MFPVCSLWFQRGIVPLTVLTPSGSSGETWVVGRTCDADVWVGGFGLDCQVCHTVCRNKSKNRMLDCENDY